MHDGERDGALGEGERRGSPAVGPRRVELLIARRPDRGGAAGQDVRRGDIPKRAVQALVIVVRDEAGHQSARLRE